MKKFVNIYIFAIVILFVVIVVGCVSYNIGIGPTTKESNEDIFESFGNEVVIDDNFDLLD